MIDLTGEQLALIGAAIARIAHSEAHNFSNSDADIANIAKSAGAEFWKVYDKGPYGKRTRYLRLDYTHGTINIEVGPQPEFVNHDNRPDGDGPPPGSPIAMAA